MRKLFTLVAAGALVLGTATAAQAGIGAVTANLSVTIGTLPPAGFSGGAAAASSAGVGGAATLPANAVSGTFATAINPPLVGIIGGVAVAGPGQVAVAIPAMGPATNNPLAWNGTTGTMSLNASAYLASNPTSVPAAEIPLAVVGVGGMQAFHVITFVSGNITANPYQLGSVTLMGSLNGTNHTIMDTGVDNRTAAGNGTLVLVSPTNVSLGALGNLAAIARLTLTYSGIPTVPEPGTLLLLGTGFAGLIAVGRKRMA
jgi:hypothetical protein